MTHVYTSYITDPTTGGQAGCDPMTNAIECIDYAHHETHGGGMFWADHVTTSGTSVILAFATPSGTKRAHMEVEFVTESKCHVEILEGATWTTNTGTVYAPKNQNRGSASTSVLLEDKTATPAWTAGGILQDPTSVTGGTIVKRWYSFANKLSGGDGGTRHEIVLDPDETYVIEMTSDDGSKGMQLRLYWYEHTDSN